MKERTALKENSLLRINHEDSHLDIWISHVIGFGGSCIVYLGIKRDTMNSQTIESSVIIKEFFPSGADITRLPDNRLAIPNREVFELLKIHFIDGQSRHMEFYEDSQNQALPRTFFLGEANNTFYIVADHGKGETLSLIHKTVPKLSLNNIASIMESICSAISVLHEKEYLYLDCKPENFFYYGTDQALQYNVYLFDFDSVEKVSRLKTRQYQFSSASTDWIPEEQKQITDPITGGTRYNKDYMMSYHTDLYSIGATGFWLLTNRPPSEKDLSRIQEGTFDWTNESRYFIGEAGSAIAKVQSIFRDLLQPDVKKRKKRFPNNTSINKLKEEFVELYSLTIRKNSHNGSLLTTIEETQKRLTNLEEKTAGITESTINQQTDIDFSSLYTSLNRVFQKRANMKYGRNGILYRYLSQLKIKEALAGIRENYSELSDLIQDYEQAVANTDHDPDIRMLLSGDVYIGRSTQLFYFWHKTLQDRSRIVFYIPTREINGDDVFTYIYKHYLEEIPGLKNLSPKDAFRKLRNASTQHGKLLLLIDDYDGIDNVLHTEFDPIFKQDDPLMDHVDLIIKVRYKGPSWPQNYVEIMATGVDDAIIISDTAEKGIANAKIQSMITVLRSPWLFMLLLEDVSISTVTTINPGMLIYRSLRSRTDLVSQSGRINKTILSFSIFALLPQLLCLNRFSERDLMKHLYAEIKKTIQSEIIPECDEIHTEYDENTDKKELFSRFFKNPVIKTMGLMKKNNNDPRRIFYEWKDMTVENFYSALSISNLLNAIEYAENSNYKSELCLQTQQLIGNIVNPLLSLDTAVTTDEIDSSIFIAFDRARYLVDLMDEYQQETFHSFFPLSAVSLYCGMAVTYELLGEEEQTFHTARKALVLLDQKYGTDICDQDLAIRWFSKLSYFMIKCRPKIPTDQLDYAKACLEKAIPLAELYDQENLSGRIELSRLYGNMGAYYLSQKQYDKALKWHNLSLTEKQLCLSRSDGSDKRERENIMEGIRRSYVSLGTDSFYLGNYRESINYHDQAIAMEKDFLSITRFESYSRKVGSSIRFLNDENAWSTKKAEELLDNLITGLEIMQTMINRKELDMIYKHCNGVITELKNHGIDLISLYDTPLYEKALMIEKRYDHITWKNNKDIENLFLGGKYE